MKSVTVRFQPHQYEALKAEAIRTGTNMSAIVRRLIDRAPEPKTRDKK